MQGDIVPKQQSSSNPRQPLMQTSGGGGGYGSASFGASKVASTSENTPSPSLLQAPPAEPLLAEHTGTRHNKTALIVTVAGIIVFAAGVVGLFLYALI